MIMSAREFAAHRDAKTKVRAFIQRVLLCNGKWQSHSAGDTFHVPAGVVHSVANDDTEPTEQISIFLPVSENAPPNRYFETYLTDAGINRC
jgi:hypothetical protein